MGVKLCFTEEELVPIQASEKRTCQACNDRTATWKGLKWESTTETIEVCGWCALYSMTTAWGVELREEILHAGRYCQLRAVQYKKDVSDLDERGRLEPPEAERYMLGIAFSSKMLKRLGGLALRGRGPESGSTSS